MSNNTTAISFNDERLARLRRRAGSDGGGDGDGAAPLCGIGAG